METTSSSFEKIIQTQGKLVYTNTGSSMWPLLRQHRDLLIIGPPPEGRLRMWDVPLYIRDNDPRGKHVLHRILWVRKHDYIICGDNQWRPETGITDRHIIGVLEAVNRDGRLIPVRPTATHPHVPLAYKAYVFVWCAFFPIRSLLVLAWYVFRYKWRLLGNPYKKTSTNKKP